MRTLLFVFVFSFAAAFCGAGHLAAQDEVNVPEGMQLIKVGGTNVLVPKGTKITQRDALLLLEPLDEYTSRLLKSLEEKIADLSARIAGLQDQLAAVQSRLQALEKKEQ